MEEKEREEGHRGRGEGERETGGGKRERERGREEEEGRERERKNVPLSLNICVYFLRTISLLKDDTISKMRKLTLRHRPPSHPAPFHMYLLPQYCPL